MFLLATMAGILPTHAADLGVLTSIDVCDALGISGMMISSDANCLQISGEVYYEFFWGDYQNVLLVGANPLAYSGDFAEIDGPGVANDWASYVESYLRVSGSAQSDFGTAKAYIELLGYEDLGYLDADLDYEDPWLAIEQAYVSIGDSTILSAGKQYTIANLDDDEAFGWLPTLLSDDIEGVGFDTVDFGTFEDLTHSIQFQSDIGNGFRFAAGLESLELGVDELAGNAVGVLSYASDTLTAHVSLVAADILDGELEDFAFHSGVTATLDAVKLRAALAGNDQDWWSGLFSAETTVDIFSLAATVDATSEREWGAVLAGSVNATDAVVLNAALRYLDSDTDITDDEGFELRGGVDYAVSETLTLTAEVGHIWVGANANAGEQAIFDALLEGTWTPGGDFEATFGVAGNTLGAYKTSFTASKAFE